MENVTQAAWTSNATHGTLLRGMQDTVDAVHITLSPILRIDPASCFNGGEHTFEDCCDSRYDFPSLGEMIWNRMEPRGNPFCDFATLAEFAYCCSVNADPADIRYDQVFRPFLTQSSPQLLKILQGSALQNLQEKMRQGSFPRQDLTVDGILWNPLASAILDAMNFAFSETRRPTFLEVAAGTGGPQRSCT
eukprot:gb/GFBE01006355.1/.p1 GENE.gb/GFBE01006355.1/~~gb/GFBE01006355.1/.p1  ORF type:complete len:191 (+),score=16.14 gb/GFBE01006355.1/:1-573(+)